MSQGTNGIVIVDNTGATVKTLPITSAQAELDDSGNIYNLDVLPAPSPSPSSSAMPTAPPPIVQFYPAGATTPTGTYSVSAGAPFEYELTSGAGEFAFETAVSGTGGTVNLALGVWNPGVTSGTANYTITATQYGSPAVDMQHDGTLYIGSISQSGTYAFSVYPPGSATPSRTIPESIVPASQQANFAPNYLTVGPDGTLYVTEYSFVRGDPLAGLYIYPPNGPEKFVATTSDANGAGPDGIDIDAVGNIYVANNNAGLDPNNSYAEAADTLHDIEVFAPGGASVLRHITGTFDPYPLVVAPNGTMFFGSFNFGTLTSGTNGTFLVQPGATTATQVAQFGETQIVLYNGYAEAAAWRHRESAQSAAASVIHAGGPAALRAYLKSIHRIP